MKPRNRGFGLIELLVSILIGLIVVGGITSLVVATLRANTENLQMTRLTQDMRSVMQLVTRDLRRAGYDQQAIRDFGAGSQVRNEFAEVRAFDSSGTQLPFENGIDSTNPATCVTYQWDDNGDGSAQAGEAKGIRLNETDNSLEMKTAAGSVGNSDGDPENEILDTDCDAGTWETLTDPASVRVDEFALTTVDGLHSPIVWEDPSTKTTPELAVRELVITLTATVKNDQSIQRSMRETVRVRNDYLY